jgi:PBP1b-binding outer membrane lipoprotein LpoB
MRQNVVISLACVLTAIVLLPGCGGRKYADVEQTSNQCAGLIENYAAALDKAGGAPDVAKATNQFVDKMEKLMPAMQKLKGNIPSWRMIRTCPNRSRNPEQMEEAAKKMMVA